VRTAGVTETALRLVSTAVGELGTAYGQRLAAGSAAGSARSRLTATADAQEVGLVLLVVGEREKRPGGDVSHPQVLNSAD
jgi:hypothetical protein